MKYLLPQMAEYDGDVARYHAVFFMLSDGTEGEIWLGSARHLTHIHSGPYNVLLDTTGILAGAVFPEVAPTPSEQIEILRRLITWFWHDLFHFTTSSVGCTVSWRSCVDTV